MKLAAVVAQDVTAAAFVALGLAITFQWFRERRPALAMLAGALDSIALVALIGRLSPLLPASLGPPINVLLLAAFMTSGYFLLRFRDTFIPLSDRARMAARILLGVSIVDGILLVTVLQNGPRPIVSLVLFEYVGAWAIFIGEPIVRFWLASISLPSVQKIRMRFLSGGFAVWILIVIVSSVAGAATQSPLAVLITQLIALATVPLIYFSFSPPALLRRLWRMSEESALRGSMQDLLIFSPSRQALAERAIFWAVRLVGATAGFVVDSDGKIMAVIGMDKSEAATLSSRSESSAQVSAGQLITAPLHLSEGPGKLAVVAGPFSPVFGSEEIAQLKAYANSVTAGLERARVTERMTAIEKNKTQFLNLASHELRGPVTVIRGYVSMLEDGMLGKLNERGRKAAAVMAAKVSEMNELIEEMIDAARLEDGGLTMRSVELDLRDVVREAT
ncbi:MAG TPA: histidine kinase dimerization/phospho-acceptor domain-containing protein, partial [Candidatus Dormibacteraeota bacterium]|nr:histidine kinase dimerization/phospho-acceptor domain-containing protein [Candidatus Dormibacteraeota bacterium]